MSANVPSGFVRAWIGSWNRRDLDSVLAHYADDVSFVSPKAAQFAGNPCLSGKTALRAYWAKALEDISSIRFTLDHVLWDGTRSTLVIVYDAELNGAHTRAAELMRFGDNGQVIAGEALYGAALAA